MISNPPVGKACETTALLVPSKDLAFKPLVDMLKVWDFYNLVAKTLKMKIKGAGKERWCYDHGKPIVVPMQKEGGEICERCDIVGNELGVCPVIISLINLEF